MKLIVTGLPRHRSSLITKALSNSFNLSMPNNEWGETHKFGEQINNWLVSDNSIFKVWGPFNSNFEQILEEFDGNIIVTYSDNLPLFIAKLLRAHVLRDYAINLHDTTPISFLDNIEELEKIRPLIAGFRSSLDKIFLNKKIILKSVFVNERDVFAHIQSSISPEVIDHLEKLCISWKSKTLESYINHNEIPEYYEYVHKTFGYTIC